MTTTTSAAAQLDVQIVQSDDILNRLAGWNRLMARLGQTSLSRHPGWLEVFRRGFQHEPFCLVGIEAGETVGLMALALVESRLFGRFLVSLPYLNSGGVLAADAPTATALVDRAAELADRWDVRYLELRHEHPIEHPKLGHTMTSKVHMRLPLPGTTEALWNSFKPKVRNQIRKGEKAEFSLHWGGETLLDEFYDVFARNMRDLGTPVFGRRLFRAIVTQFPDQAEFCVARSGNRPAAAALLLHGGGTTEVPSASALRRYNPSNVNMLMYWHLLCRAVERGQATFDFGRSSQQSNTYRFKKQWGAEPHPACWQYYVRQGTVGDMRPEGGKYDRMIRLWQRLPVWLTRLIGPPIVRGIP